MYYKQRSLILYMDIKRIIIFLFGYVVFLQFCCGQTTADCIKYTVQRGETIESIAKKYSLSLRELSEYNHNMDVFYTGMTINIPVSSKAMGSNNSNTVDINQISAFLSECSSADDLLNDRKYRKATKAYSRILEKYGNVMDCADVYYSRGLSYYNRRKWKSAMRDLNTAMSLPGCTSAMRKHCKELYANAEQAREELHERNASIFAGVLGAGLQTASVVMTAKSVSNSSTYSTVTTGAHSRNTNLDYLLDPRYAMMQVAQAEQAEYALAKSARPDLTLEQFRIEKAQAYQLMKEAENNTTSTGNTTLTSTADEAISNILEDAKTRYGDKECHICRGMKKCTTCNGKGWIRHTMTNTTGDCPNCTNGLCSTCGGDGIVYGLK